MQVPGAFDLGCHDPPEAFPRLLQDDAVVENPSRVDQASQRLACVQHGGRQAVDVIRVSNVGLDSHNPGAGAPQTFDGCGGFAGRLTPADQNEMTGALLNQRFRDLQSERAKSTGHQIAPVSANGYRLGASRHWRRRKRHNDLANVPRLRHISESVGDSRDRKRGVPQRRQRARVQPVGHEVEHVLDDLGVAARYLHQVERKVRHVGAARLRVLHRPDATLAELDKPTAGSEDVEASVDELPAQRVQHDIDTPSASEGHDARCEIRRTRAHDVLHAERAQIFPLRRACSREDFGACLLRPSNRSQAHAAGGGMDQDLIFGTYGSQRVKAVVGGEKRQRQRGGFLERHVTGLARDKRLAHGHEAAKRIVRRHGDHVLPDGHA